MSEQIVNQTMVQSEPRPVVENSLLPRTYTYTNADALRADLIPCETNPSRGSLSRTVEPFHGVAAVTVGSQKGNLRHVCEECADKWHRHQARVGGIAW